MFSYRVLSLQRAVAWFKLKLTLIVLIGSSLTAVANSASNDINCITQVVTLIVSVPTLSTKMAETSSSEGPSLSYTITKQWNSLPPTDNAEIRLKFSSYNSTAEAPGLLIEIDAPFYNDPIVPPTLPIGSTDGLWDYEVVEVFFLSESEEKYLETEFAPKGHYLLLELDTDRNVLKNELPLMNYMTVIDNVSGRWQGKAVIPWEYLPSNVNKFNAYAIHKSDPERVYMSLFPTPYGEYENPDFHRLYYFQSINLTSIMNH